MELRSIAFCGKIPSAGDYVRSGFEAPWQRTLFDWLVEGWNRSVASGTVRDLAGIVHLLVTLDTPGAFASLLLCPSRDRVGRRFPFVLMAELRAPQTTCGEALVLLAPHCLRSTPIAELAARGLDQSAIRAHVDSLKGGSPLPDIERHRQWRRGAGLAELRAGTGDMRPWLRALAFARSTAAVPDFVVRGECASGIDEVAATVDICVALGRHPARVIGTDLPLQAEARWRLGCADLQPRLLRPLVWHDAPSELAWDLAKELANVPADFSGPVEDGREAATVQEFLDEAHRG